MYAVIESGNKQYRVELGSEIQVDRLEAQAGDSVTLDRVLLIADGDTTAVGRPIVEGAMVSADVLRQERGDKIVVFKYKPKARTRVKKGFRAELTTLRISEIAFGGRSAAKDAQQSEAEREKAAEAAEQAAAAKAAADIELAARLAATAETSNTEQAEATETRSAAPKAAKTRSASTKTASSGKKTAASTAAAETTGDEPAADSEAPAEADAAGAPDDTKKDE